MSASSWAGFNIVVRKLQATGAKYNSLSPGVRSSVVSAAVLATLSISFDEPAAWLWTSVPLDIWLWVTDVGWSNGVSFGLRASLLGRYAANRVAPFSLGVPVFGILAGVLILGETVTMPQWIGGGFVMLALGFVASGGATRAARRSGNRSAWTWGGLL